MIYTLMKQRITLKFIAEKAGVNQATVSRALNPSTVSLISEKVRTDIQKICDTYGYRPSLRGRSIVTGKTFKIGMILGNMQDDFSAHDWARIICILSSELQHHNYALTLLHADGSESMDNQVKNFLMSGIADGYVTGPSMVGNEVFNLIQKLNVPLWVVCNPHNKIDSVNHILRDDIPALTEIWKNIPPDCCSKCAFFAHDNDDNKFRLADIQKSAIQTFPNENINIAPLLFHRSSHFSATEYRDAAKNAAKMLDSIKNHKVIWCESDFVALALYDVLEANDIRVGHDIHIIGYGNLETYSTDTEDPILSTVSANVEQIGITLAKALIAEINGHKTESNIINASFISRKTFMLPAEPGCDNTNN